MKHILVTGAGGYIGSVLVPKLLEKGYRVSALDRYFFGREKLPEAEGLTILREDSRKIGPQHMEGIDAVIDLVAISNDPSGEEFSEATRQINGEGRINTAKAAKDAGVKQYVLPSSCSIYGFQESKVDETSSVNPLTTYAKANYDAEQAIVPMGDGSFCVTVLRQATVFGYGPRMRFDLAINGMSYGAWKSKKLPLMRDGKQYRPMVHVQDTTDVMIKLLETDPALINRQLFNVGSEENNYQIGPLGEIVAKIVSQELHEDVEIEWYGDPDHRSYMVSFDKIEKTLNWKAQWNAERGVKEIVAKLNAGELDKTLDTITLAWYKELEKWAKIIHETEMYGGILNLKE